MTTSREPTSLSVRRGSARPGLLRWLVILVGGFALGFASGCAHVSRTTHDNMSMPLNATERQISH